MTGYADQFAPDPEIMAMTPAQIVARMIEVENDIARYLREAREHIEAMDPTTQESAG